MLIPKHRRLPRFSRGSTRRSQSVVRLSRRFRLLETINPQPGGGWGGEPAILEAIYQVVGHLQMHTGQIILLTKQMVGHDLDLTIPRKR